MRTYILCCAIVEAQSVRWGTIRAVRVGEHDPVTATWLSVGSKIKDVCHAWSSKSHLEGYQALVLIKVQLSWSPSELVGSAVLQLSLSQMVAMGQTLIHFPNIFAASGGPRSEIKIKITYLP